MRFLGQWLRRRHVAALAAAAMLVVPGAVSAQTSCDSSRRFGYEFAGAAAEQLSYTSNYSRNATNGIGQSVPFTISFATNGISSTVINGVQMPRVTNLINDGAPTTANNLMIGMTLAGRTADISGTTRFVRTIFTFASPVREVTVQVNDIDFTANQFRDWLLVTGSNGAATYAPAISTPFGTNNGTGPRSGSGSVVVLGTATTPLTVATSSEALGNGLSDNNDTLGTITASFAQPITSISLTYGNSGQAAGGTTTGQQAYGIQYIRFCGMPQPALTKTSSSETVTGVNRFSVPGADRLYTITLTNNGGSSIDLSGAAIEDALPTDVDFRNIEYSSGSGSPFQITASGGATITGAVPSYANTTSGGTFTYAPTAGYDGNVRRFRITGTGSVPVGGAITVRFRARID